MSFWKIGIFFLLRKIKCTKRINKDLNFATQEFEILFSTINFFISNIDMMSRFLINLSSSKERRRVFFSSNWVIFASQSFVFFFFFFFFRFFSFRDDDLNILFVSIILNNLFIFFVIDVKFCVDDDTCDIANSFVREKIFFVESSRREIFFWDFVFDSICEQKKLFSSSIVFCALTF